MTGSLSRMVECAGRGGSSIKLLAGEGSYRSRRALRASRFDPPNTRVYATAGWGQCE